MDAVRVVFFDLDDTLCGYWEAAKVGLRKAFEEAGPSGIDAETMVRHWATAFREFAPTLKETGWYKTYLKTGEPTRTEQMRRTLLVAGIDDAAMARGLGDAYAEHRNDALELFPEALEVLEALRDRGYPLGLITNGPGDIQRQELETLGIEDRFSIILIEGEQGLGKPNPEVFLRAEERSGAKGAEILFVGNSYAHDIRPALAAGWRAIWVRRPTDVPPSGSHPEERPADLPAPTAEVSDLREVLELLPAR
ncbi:MAG TPA: HAD family hydrolase [Fimbriimonadaceae bacterium]|nr:HAD family hydrolase [Fimbriimonadaceae bacterium]